MYLSAEQTAIANKAVTDTFEQSSIAWQAIPHWNTGDPGQFRVRSDNAAAPPVAAGALAPPILPGDSLELEGDSIRFEMTVAQAIAPTPDPLLAAVIARTVQLAASVDATVIGKLLTLNPLTLPTAWQIQDYMNALLAARATVEKAGYRAPSCLLTDTTGLTALNQLVAGLPDYQVLLDAANINSLYRFDDFTGTPGQMVLLGRRQRIAQGAAASTTAGEEPVDLAVSLLPSLELVGDTDDANIEMAVRIRYAPRITDVNGVVNIG